MATVDEQVSSLKSDFPVVDAIGVYDSSLGKFIYKDDLGDVSFFHSMLASNSLIAADFFYLDYEEVSFFVKVMDAKLAILRLTKNAPYNKVLLELRSSSLLC